MVATTRQMRASSNFWKNLGQFPISTHAQCRLVNPHIHRLELWTARRSVMSTVDSPGPGQAAALVSPMTGVGCVIAATTLDSALHCWSHIAAPLLLLLLLCRADDYDLHYGPITIAIRARFEYDSSAIRARYNILRGVMCFRAIMNMSILTGMCFNPSVL